jgi:hypothetical protein
MRPYCDPRLAVEGARPRPNQSSAPTPSHPSCTSSLCPASLLAMPQPNTSSLRQSAQGRVNEAKPRTSMRTLRSAKSERRLSELNRRSTVPDRFPGTEAVHPEARRLMDVSHASSR